MRLAAPAFRRLCVLAAVAAFAAAGLAACQSVKNVSDVNADTSVQETIGLLEEGVAEVGLRAARRNIRAWQARLRSEDAPALDDIAGALDDLQAELQADVIDAEATGQLLGRLGEETRAAAQRDGAPSRLGRLAALLSEAGKRLQ